LIVGGEVYKLELLIEVVRSTPLKLTINDGVHQFDLTKGSCSLKIISKRSKNIKIETNTFDIALINQDVAQQRGIKIVDIYVNGIGNNTSRLALQQNNFESSVLDKTGFVVEKNHILRKGEYGELILKFKEATDTYRYPKKLNLDRQLSFYSHRSGWNYVLNEMTALNSESGVYCDGFIENNFSLCRSDSIAQKVIPYKKNWIGFMHNPPNTPAWFSDKNAFSNVIFQDPYFLDSLKRCKGIYTFSEYHASFVRQYLPYIQVESLYHPTEIPDVQFDFEKFVQNENKKLITIGWWLRKLNAAYMVNPKGYQKVRLLPNNRCKETIARLEKTEELINNRRITQEQRNSVKLMEFLPNNEYDEILSENLVYLDLYDSSANNTVIECIARGTPLFVNRTPAVVEYLGDAYPLYIDSQFDLEQKIQDLNLIRRTHLYLKSIRYKVEIGYFLDSLVNSKIYKGL
jgi:hypothetical protein